MYFIQYTTIGHNSWLFFCKFFLSFIHTSKINVLWSSLNSKETLQNFLYLYKKKTQVVFFVFHFKQLSFFPYECPAYVDIDQGIHKGKNESCSKWKTKKTTWVFFLYKYRKFWSISLEFKLERKTFILEVWNTYQKLIQLCGYLNHQLQNSLLLGRWKYDYNG